MAGNAARRRPAGVRRRGGRPAHRGRRASRQAADPGPGRRRVPHRAPEDDRPAVRGRGRASRSTRTSASPCCWRDGREIRFRDIRKFGRVGALRGRRPTRSTASGRSRWTRRSRCARSGRGSGAGARRLKPLLVDQSFLAGVGNIYADEALWRLEAAPAPLRRVAAAARRAAPSTATSWTILTEAVERRGSSIDDYTAPDGDGEMQEHLDVYQRTGRPCPRCGRPIRRIVIGIRATHFCSWCQRLPARGAGGGGEAILATHDCRGPAGAASGRRGRRWVDLDGEGSPGPHGRRTAKDARTARAASATRAGGSATGSAPRPGAAGLRRRAP